MVVELKEDAWGLDRVVVFHNDDDQGVLQPSSFCCRGRGAHLYHRRAIPLFELIEFTLECGGESGDLERIMCTGMVVQCKFEPTHDLYQIEVQFLDLPESVRKQIEELTTG